MNKVVTIMLSEHGESLGSRALAESIREIVIEHVRADKKILFDFNGLDVISSAFADELFGKLHIILGADTFKNNIKFNGFKNEDSKNLIIAIINKSISYRLQNKTS